MADRKQLKKADQSDIHSDDPFAELTRIMGFDPRVPVTRGGPSSVEGRKSASNDEDDLSMDLEKELMSEFEDLGTDAQAQTVPEVASSPASLAQADPVSEEIDAQAQALDVVFDADLAEPPHDPVASVAAEGELADELDAAFAAEPDLEISVAIAGDVTSDDATVTGYASRNDEAVEEGFAESTSQQVTPSEPDDEQALLEEFHTALAEEPAFAASEELSTIDVEAAAPEFSNPLVHELEKHFMARQEAFEPEAQPQGSYDEAAQDRGVDDDAAADDYDAADDLPLIPLGATRDFGHVQGSEAAVDMDFEAEFAAELDQAAATISGSDDDDLEAELSALIGKGAAVAVGVTANDAAPAADLTLEDSEQVSDRLADELAAAIDTAYDSDESAFSDVAPQIHGHAYDEEPATFAEDGHDAGYAESDHAVDPVEVPGSVNTYSGLAQQGMRAYRQSNPFEAVPSAEAVHETSQVMAARADEQPVAAGGPADDASQTPLKEQEDPFAMLAAMMSSPEPISPPAASSVSASLAEPDVSQTIGPDASETPAVPTQYQYQNHSYTNRAPVDVPDIETVDVPETAVALADDLDIPDVAFEDDLPLAADFDDFEAELASAFGQQASSAAAPAAPEPSRAAPSDFSREAYHHEFAQPAHPVASASHAGNAAMAAAAVLATHAAATDSRARDRDHDFDGLAGAGTGQVTDAYQGLDDDDLEFDPELNEEMAIPSYRDAERQPSKRRGLFVAAVAGGLAVIGGIGALAWSSSGGGDSDAPALVRADTDPVKVRPENPGGTVVPNQDNKVFQTMNGTDTDTAPKQEKLISGNEEPVDVAARANPPANASDPETVEDAMLMAGDEDAATDDPIAAEIESAPKGEDRVAANGADELSANDAVVAVTPRRVRTMVVRPDGTLVPSEEPVLSGAQTASAEQVPAGADAAALEPADPSKDLADPAVTSEATASLKPDNAAPTASVEATASSQTPKAAVAATSKAEATAPKPQAEAEQSMMPASGPVAPSRPADQPLEVVGEVKPQQVAAATTAATPAGAWSVQIASQPSEAAAKSSYEDLARRYASVIGDRGVNIVKAEIAGKGTFWRVRVPAGTRSEAVSLCESYKAAGGNCFVSK